ncbi:unnamed protein product [Blepharisma stoltei]|uniref:Uncharacterized protein n=1 Tax=Blepharisma stoltei TaxID=1481888 RepID=A0AAU9IV50_9CILI|nr:unnamed protein product [Blepharisma stoltei]
MKVEKIKEVLDTPNTQKEKKATKQLIDLSKSPILRKEVIDTDEDIASWNLKNDFKIQSIEKKFMHPQVKAGVKPLSKPTVKAQPQKLRPISLKEKSINKLKTEKELIEIPQHNKENNSLTGSKDVKKVWEILKEDRRVPLSSIILNPALVEVKRTRFSREQTPIHILIRSKSRPVSVEREIRNSFSNLGI